MLLKAARTNERTLQPRDVLFAELQDFFLVAHLLQAPSAVAIEPNLMQLNALIDTDR